MDLPRPALLKQIRLRVSAEGRGTIYLAQDQANGKIFALPASVANVLRRMKAAAAGDRSVRATIDNDDAREAYKFLHMIQSMRDVDTLKRKPVNPVFANFPLFDVGPLQAGLQPLADRLVTRGYLVFMVLLAVVAIVLGVRNDWSILEVFQNIFSIEALITFGLMAPFLKLIHEFGHVLVATKARVRVRKAGLYLIGLYPMPYVDCTEADMTAKRADRIAISLAGIIVDVTIGLSAFIAWYLIEGSYLRTLLGNIFMYLTLNSVLFNANPLIKLDGYYALTDAIGARNLYTRASKTLRDLRIYVMSLGKGGARPVLARQWALIGYGVLALIYRINILFVIAAALIPKYLGVGAAVAIWGGMVMFLAPMLQDRAPAAPTPPDVKRRQWSMRIGLVALIVLALFFVKLPFRTTVEMKIDVAARYQVTSDSRGYVAQPVASGERRAGVPLAKLQNLDLRDRLALTQTDLEGAMLSYETVRGDDPAKAQAALQAINTNRDQLAILRTQEAGLSILAPEPGLFVPHHRLSVGTFLDSGSAIGAFFPSAGEARFSGDFDERYYDKFQDGPDMYTLRLAGNFYDLLPERVTLQSTVTRDAESGIRSYTLKADVPFVPAQVAHLPATVRVRFPPAPLWQHVQFVWQKILANYREAQLLDREKLLEN
jgi:hypothetical protein